MIGDQTTKNHDLIQYLRQRVKLFKRKQIFLVKIIWNEVNRNVIEELKERMVKTIFIYLKFGEQCL